MRSGAIAKVARKRTDFAENITASLAITPAATIIQPRLGIMNTLWSYTYNFLFRKMTPLLIESAPAPLPVIQDEAIQKIEAVKHLIKEHAERRVDLFFYLLVSVYKKQVMIEKAKTIQQNGKGSSENKTQACHSSLFPNVALRQHQPEPTLWKTIWQSITRQLEVASECPNLKNTYFMEALNSTVELPKIVNDFDGKLEGRGEQSSFIDGCLIILNKAAKGEIDPRQGMNDFFKLMEIFFNHYEKKKKNVGAMRKVWEYQKEGTFKAANKNMSVREDYLHMMLRINANELRKVKLFSLVTHSALQPHYKKIQDEIFGNFGKKNSREARSKV